jgi:alanine-glyoxylate transaminase/serine-glyoxylate transaminase/serine-pyruvate transaminase
LSPVTFSKAATDVIDKRKTKVQSWYLDMTLVRQYWGESRVYHHTAPINMTYGLREALRIIHEEGLEARIERHALNHRALKAGLAAMSIEYIPQHSLATLNAVTIPSGVDDAKVRTRLLNDFGIEIGAGLGPFKGKAWRIGLMGHASNRRNVTLFLAALESILAGQGIRLKKGEALAAASAVYVV